MRDTTGFITSPKKSNQAPVSQDFVSVIILGENHGYRMKSYGPSPLINIDGKTLLGKQISAIRSTFIHHEIVLCTGFDSDKVVSTVKEKFSDANIRIVENQIHFNSNCCESVRLCLNNISNTKVVILGGGIDVTSKHLQSLDLSRNEIMVQEQEDDTNFEIGAVTLDNGKLGHLTFGVDGQYWTEVICLNGERSVSTFQKIVSGPEYKTKFLFEAINVFANRNKMRVRVNDDREIMKIDNVKTIRKTSKL